ncbi:MAG TPA: PilZ domain-containing protein [Gammaproteobacteria bacterium]|nr:PilZ domain-containing protein [Gammaproteobacteria bacterium]
MNEGSTENQIDEVDENRRSEERYTCAGIPLLYSSLTGSCIDDLADSLQLVTVYDMSLSGLAFDVDRAMKKGDKMILIMEQSEEGMKEGLSAEVRWCDALPSGKYRIGVAVELSENAMKANTDEKMVDIITDKEFPKEIEIRCSTCQADSIFNFFSEQPVLSGSGLLPLYNCSVCNATRTLPGILINRKISRS